MASNHTTLDAAASDRKARLAKLAAVKRKQSSDNQDDAEQPDNDKKETGITKKYLSGRNYDLEAEAPRLGFENNPADAVVSVEQRAKVVADEAKAQAEIAQKEDKPLDLFTLQPKKPNWDLKRDLAAKMELLDQRTDNAIARLVRERVGAQQKKEAQSSADGAGEQVGMDGVDLVNSVHEREREEAEEERLQAAQDAMES